MKHDYLLCHFAYNIPDVTKCKCVANVKSSTTDDATKVQLNTGCHQNSSLSSNHLKTSLKNLSHKLFAFPWLSMT